MLCRQGLSPPALQLPPESMLCGQTGLELATHWRLECIGPRDIQRLPGGTYLNRPGLLALTHIVVYSVDKKAGAIAHSG